MSRYHAYVAQYTSADVTFEQWLEACDHYVGKVAGVDLDALGDGMSRDAYDDEVTVKEYCHRQLEEAGFPLEALVD